ncbi:unnamed protein product [Caenorhabditis angaria]|uniref:SCP domain-containing protein n=1 Tax=Caenorhabditis angaria TaxID=860376 RepID=A0A9P1N355_9PELO|nr:unnamed protein product [Caenorhabditis angaria]
MRIHFIIIATWFFSFVISQRRLNEDLKTTIFKDFNELRKSESLAPIQFWWDYLENLAILSFTENGYESGFGEKIKEDTFRFQDEAINPFALKTHLKNGAKLENVYLNNIIAVGCAKNQVYVTCVYLK